MAADLFQFAHQSVLVLVLGRVAPGSNFGQQPDDLPLPLAVGLVLLLHRRLLHLLRLLPFHARPVLHAEPRGFIDVRVRVGLVVGDLDVVPLAVVEGELGHLGLFLCRGVWRSWATGGWLCLFVICCAQLLGAARWRRRGVNMDLWGCPVRWTEPLLVVGS